MESIKDELKDEEERAKLQDCVDLLVAAGYFRARVKGLSAFDRVVGGLVWCISACNYTVDVDLLYSENSTIGQKIALTEKICEMLPKLRCTYFIEPHQIQGLDIFNIFPVIQWLVQKTIEARELHGDRNKEFVDFLARGKSKAPEKERKTPRNLHFNAPAKQQHVKAGSSKELIAAVRRLNHDQAPSLEESLEYEHNLISEALKKSLVPLPESGTLPSTSGVQEPTEEDLDREIEKLLEEKAQLMAEKESEEHARQEAQDQYRELKSRLRHCAELEANLEPSALDELRQKYAAYLAIAEQEAAFKKNCIDELERLEAQIERMEQSDSQETDLRTYRDQLRVAEEELAEARAKSARVTRETASLQRAIDSVPSRIELTQYHRRLIELYNQMGSKHRQTRQYVSSHNYLVDLRNYMKKEIGLLNSIEEALPMAKREENKDSFQTQLATILRGVESNLEKLETQEKDLDAKKEVLEMEIGFQRDKDRAFAKAMDDLKTACDEIENLRKQLPASD
ncbi:unnamed protein product, partial [Mesorhabditis spiculigera]